MKFIRVSVMGGQHYFVNPSHIVYIVPMGINCYIHLTQPVNGKDYLHCTPSAHAITEMIENPK